MVDKKHAFKLAHRLSTIPDCPRADQAIEALAEDLETLCSNDDEATWLANEARKWTKWRGTAGLMELIDAKRRPSSIPLERRTIDLGPRPTLNCAACQDWGYVWRGGRNEYCTCAEGARLQAEDPGLLDTLNRKGSFRGMPALQAVPPPRPITEADLEAAFLDRQRKKDEVIAHHKAVLHDNSASKEQKEIARDTLHMLGAEE